jgi:hypothetical protein
MSRDQGKVCFVVGTCVVVFAVLFGNALLTPVKISESSVYPGTIR